MATPYTSDSSASITGDVSSGKSSVFEVPMPVSMPSTSREGDNDEIIVDVVHNRPDTVVEAVTSMAELYDG
ncbi:hypothetical protein COOONC_03268 [Cooperia oncophora]